MFNLFNTASRCVLKILLGLTSNPLTPRAKTGVFFLLFFLLLKNYSFGFDESRINPLISFAQLDIR